MNLTKVLSISLLLSISAAQAANSLTQRMTTAIVKTGSYAAPIILIPSAMRLFRKDPKPDAKPRYDLNKLLDTELAKNDPKAYLENYWLLIDDGFIGQYFKDKHMVWKPDGTIKQSRKAMPFGILGWTWSYIKTQEKAVKFIVPVVGAYDAMSGGYSIKFLQWMGYSKKEDKAAPTVQVVDNAELIKAFKEEAKADREAAAKDRETMQKIATAIAQLANQQKQSAVQSTNNNDVVTSDDENNDNK